MVNSGARSQRQTASSAPRNASDEARHRRHLYEKAKRAKEGKKRTEQQTASQQRHGSAAAAARREPSNSRRMPLLAETRVDDDDDSNSLSSLEAESTFSQPPTPKVYLPKTLGSLSSVLTHESSDFDESTLPSMASTDPFLHSPMSSTVHNTDTYTSAGTTSRSQTLSPASFGSRTFLSQVNMKQATSDVHKPSPKHRQKLNQWYQKKLLSSKSTQSIPQDDTKTLDDQTMEETATYMSYYSDDDDDEDATAVSSRKYRYHDESGTVIDDNDGDYLKTKQNVAYFSIGLTGVQLLILMMQLAMCGIASVEMNPMIGPYPDAYSEFGGKNTYLMISQQQWWRLVTPSFLHVGILHLLANAFCQLEAIALFEREWGSFRWLLVYLISSVGCSGMASIFDPDTIAVGSSGALMGLYAAKLAQVTTGMCFTMSKKHMNNAIRLDQLSSVLCGLTLVSMLSCFTYIDWSGHFGGLVSGFLSGMVLFSYPIKSCCSWFFWSLLGLAGLVGTLAAVFYYLMLTYDPFEELGDVCEYFRALFPETYECGCMNL